MTEETISTFHETVVLLLKGTKLAHVCLPIRPGGLKETDRAIFLSIPWRQRVT